MKYLVLILSLYFYSCSDQYSGGSTSETTNALILSDSISYINEPNVSEAIYWKMKYSDSLQINLFPPQLNRKIVYAELAQTSKWNLSLIENQRDTLSHPLEKLNPEVFKADSLSIQGQEYIDLELEFIYGEKRIIVDQGLPLFSDTQTNTLIDTLDATTGLITKGTTWQIHDVIFDNVAYASCDGTVDGSKSPTSCDTLSGQSLCSESFRILCQVSEDLLRPSYGIDDQNPLYSQGWGGGEFDFTEEITGDSLVSLEAANQYCKNAFGSQAKMAEYHQSLWHKDMSISEKLDSNFVSPFSELEEGGWGFWMYIPPEKLAMTSPNIFEIRFWVAMNSQKANCWD